MKEIVKTSRLLGYLEKMFRQLNMDKFGGELEMPIITVMSTPKSYGHVTCRKVWKSKDVYCYELNIGAGTLGRPIESVVSTLLHEMVHIYNLMHDIKDTSRGYTYHNKKFRDKAVEVGLIVEHDERLGWSVTSPSDALIEYIIDQDWPDILINRIETVQICSGSDTAASSSGQPEKKPSSTRKYICSDCGMSVRATRDVNIICADCFKLMVKA